MKTLLSCLLVGLSAGAMAQNSSVVPNSDAVGKPVRVVESNSSNQPATSMLMPVKCDKDGNIYARLYHGRNPQREPVHMLDRKGKHKVVYSVAADPQFVGRGKGGIEFAIAANGDVYQLASADDGTYIVSFNKDGSIRSKVKLSPQLAARRFAVFDSGRFLVTGTDRETAANLNPHSLFTGIFDENGKLLRKVVFPEDKSYEEAADRGDSDFLEPGLEGGGNFAVERGDVERGSDGNVYVVRWVYPAKVYAVADTGQIVRTFEVRPELEGRKPSFLHAGDGKLAFHFIGDEIKEDRRAIIKVVGLDGREYATYDTTLLGISLACYSPPERFTFLGITKDGKLRVDVSEP